MRAKARVVKSEVDSSVVLSFVPLQEHRSTKVTKAVATPQDQQRKLIPLNGKLPSYFTPDFQADIFELFDELEVSIAREENPEA